MATTNKGIYYPNNYSNVADVPEDMKKLAESVDTVVGNLDTNKVDKVDGKGLSTNDYTNEDKAKLDSLENYDDTEITQEIEDIQAKDESQDTEIDKQSDLIQKLKDNCINVTTEEVTSLQVQDASTLPAKLDVRGNHRQKVTKTAENIFDGKLELGAWDYNTGEKVDNSSQMRSTDYIDVEGQTQISIVKKEAGTFTVGIRYYADDKSYIGRASINDATDAITTTIVNNIDDTKSVKYATLTFTHSTDTSEIFAVNKGADLTWHDFIPNSPSLDYPSKVRAVGDNVNVLPNNAVSTSHNGVNYTINEDGSIYAVGTATSNSQVILAGQMSSTEEIMKLRKGVQYKNVGNVDIIYRDTNLDYARLQEGNILTVDENVSVGCFYLQVNSGTTVDETYYPKLVEYYEGMDESYSPYGQGSVEVKKANKNWFDTSIQPSQTLNGINIINNNDGSYTINGTATSTAFLKALAIPKFLANYTYVCFGLPNDCLTNISYIGDTYGENIIKFTPKNSLTNVQIRIPSGVTVNATIKPMLIEGNSDLTISDYIQHESEVYNLPIQQPMLKGDYFVKEADGWKEVHGWEKVVLTGNENSWSWNTDNLQRVSINVANGLNNPSRQMIYSNNFIYGASGSNVGIGFLYASRLYLYYPKNITSLEDWKALLQEKYNSGNPVYVYYPLATSTKLPCTEVQSNVLDQLNELELFKGTNNIITAEGLALMQMQYIADTETYIDNRIDEKLANINQQLLEIVGGN